MKKLTEMQSLAAPERNYIITDMEAIILANYFAAIGEFKDDRHLWEPGDFNCLTIEAAGRKMGGGKRQYDIEFTHGIICVLFGYERV